MILALALALASSVAAIFPSATSGGPRLPVPVIVQAPERCGPAALDMVLSFYGAEASARAEASAAYDPVLRGALITDLAAAARRAGFEASVETLDPPRLLALLEEGVPPILLYDRGLGRVFRGHFGVLAGWDTTRSEVVLLDGGSKPKRMGREALVRRWDKAGRQALIVRRHAR